MTSLDPTDPKVSGYENYKYLTSSSKLVPSTPLISTPNESQWWRQEVNRRQNRKWLPELVCRAPSAEGSRPEAPGLWLAGVSWSLLKQSEQLFENFLLSASSSVRLDGDRRWASNSMARQECKATLPK